MIDLAERWKNRAARAKELEGRCPAAKELLHFYGEVLRFQAQLAETTRQRADTGIPLTQQIDLTIAAAALPTLLRIAQKYGPATLTQAAQQLESDGETRWTDVLASPASELEIFFARACLQPLAEHLQVQYPVSTDEAARLCPACGSLPQVIILRPEGEGARRSLLCSLCLREWAFRRVLCPFCGETDKENLPYYTASECTHVRVEACDTCLHYLKSVDLSLDGLAEPLVDEVALGALDLWAFDHGYQKIANNLIGL